MIKFVGAGPGAADLITLRGQRALAEADVIIYAGSLVNPDLLEYRKAGCAVHNSAGMTLEEVLEVMLAAQAAGLRVVRLHTGDPSIFGAIREQMDRLDEAEIAYEVVPGISSFLGAAAALRAEFTLPGVSQTVILTRMEGRTPVPEKENIAALAAHRASMVVFLTASMLEGLAARLVEGGYPPETPAAIVYKATWADERVIRTSIGALAQDGAEGGISKTALVLVGDFLGADYERSKLYDPAFTHGFRQGEGDGVSGSDGAGKIEEKRQDEGLCDTNVASSPQAPGQKNVQTNPHNGLVKKRDKNVASWPQAACPNLDQNYAANGAGKTCDKNVASGEVQCPPAIADEGKA